MLTTIAVISLSQKRLILAALRKGHTNIKGTGQRGFYHGSPVSKKPLPDLLPLFLALMGPYFWRLEKEGKKGKQDKASLHLEFTLSLLLSKYLQYTQHPYWTFGDSSPQQDGGMGNLTSPVLGQKLWQVCLHRESWQARDKKARLLCSHGYRRWRLQDLLREYQNLTFLSTQPSFCPQGLCLWHRHRCCFSLLWDSSVSSVGLLIGSYANHASTPCPQSPCPTEFFL